jgi:polyphosphate glucokinase
MSINSDAERLSGKVLGIDIGGTGIKSGIVDTEKGVLTTEVKKIPTPQPSTPEAIFTVIRDIIYEFNWYGAIGCGFPAIVKKGIPRSAANISKEWIGYDALKELTKITAHPVNMINDADAAGLAEMRFGAGKAHNGSGVGVVMMITLGTGIGSAIFVDGVLLPNTELGHIEINGVEAEKNAATVVRERNGWTWEEWSKHVNRYLQTIEFLFSPDVIIIGGGVSESYEKFFPYLNVTAKLVPAQMGNNAGIIGAALGIKLRTK